jgi:hypothetical protein
MARRALPTGAPATAARWRTAPTRFA